MAKIEMSGSLKDVEVFLTEEFAWECNIRNLYYNPKDRFKRYSVEIIFRFKENGKEEKLSLDFYQINLYFLRTVFKKIYEKIENKIDKITRIEKRAAKKLEEMFKNE